MNEEGVLIAHSWLGTQTFIHLLETAPRMRDIKNHLQEASRIGAGSLFIPSVTLLPTENETLIPAEWVLALHTLTGDKLYGYHVEEGRCALDEMHLSLVGRDERRQV